MSYLHTPRFSFLGSFHANVPTRNNDLGNYSPENDIPLDTPGDWNPGGTGGFEIRTCIVTSAMNRDSKLLVKPNRDPLIGASLSSRPHGSDVIPGEFGDGKIVDLDPFQRRLSTIFGLEITLEVNTPDDQLIVTGRMEPTNFRDYWNQRALAGDQMHASTVFQSVLTDVSWNGAIETSPLLDALRTVSEQALSIKFNVDRFTLIEDSDKNLTGRLIGTIGPYVAGEQQQFVAQRRLVWTASPKASQFFAAPFQVDRNRNKLVFDFGNSVQVKEVGGAAVNDQVYAAVLPEVGSAAVPRPLVLGPPLNTTNEQLELTAGIVEAEIDAEVFALLDKHRIGLLLAPDDAQPVSAEHPSGKYIDVENWVFRVNPGETVAIKIVALHLGQPLPNEEIPFYCITRAGLEINLPPSVLFPGPNPVSAVTGPDGKATLTMSAQRGPIPGLPASRKYIDSQIYMIGDAAGWQSWGMVGPPVTPAAEQGEISPPNQRLGIVTILVFNTHPRVENPTWEEHVGPLFQRYAKLYPAMKNRIDLGLQEIVIENAEPIARSLRLPQDDPRHMPVTRDLSAFNRDLMLRWLTRQIE